MNAIDITIATAEDIRGMMTVRHDTWIATYPNVEHGITKEDLEGKLKEMHTGEEARWKERIANDPSCRAWVAKDNGYVVAFASVQKMEEENKIWSLYVLPRYHGKGIGHRLMTTALAWLGNDKPITVSVAAYNTNAIGFYVSFGFTPRGKADDPTGILPSGKTIPEIRMVKQQTNSGG